MTTWQDINLISALKKGGIVVMPTDTIYGLVASAENEQAVSRIYEVRKRAPSKPCIILIATIEEISKFGIELSPEQKQKINELWPGPVSIILEGPEVKFEYLSRGTGTLSFRLPLNEELRKLLHETGPLVAPSANPEGLPPAKNIAEARAYFGDQADYYASGGELSGAPSKVLKLHKDGSTTILRA